MGETARVYRCGECGGPNSEADRHCSFCRTPLATLRCAHCYHLNIPDNRHCAGCGEVLGLTPVRVHSELQCPECGTRCEGFSGNPGRLYDCGECGGQFVEHQLLHDLLERKRRFMKHGPLPRGNPLHREVRYVPCPVCRQFMLRRNFGGTSGIIVDWCAADGVWFEQGELTRVLAYVEAGGLADARRTLLGLPAPVGREQQARAAKMIAERINTGKKSQAPQAVEQPLSAAGVALGVAESTLELLGLIGEFILGDRL